MVDNLCIQARLNIRPSIGNRRISRGQLQIRHAACNAAEGKRLIAVLIGQRCKAKTFGQIFVSGIDSDIGQHFHGNDVDRLCNRFANRRKSAVLVIIVAQRRPVGIRIRRVVFY